MLAKDLLKDIRYSLSDVRSERWTDARLLSLLSDGLKDIAKNTILFVENTIIAIQNNTVDIDLSTRATKIVRVEYNDLPVKMYSMDEMDRRDRKWQLTKGTRLEAVVIDNQKRGCVKLYPIVENAIQDNIHYSGPYGIVTDISYSDIQPVLYNHYGDISGIPDDALVKFYYIRNHPKVTDINDELIIDELCEKPLKHYVVGHAIRDNQDTQNRQFGVEELNLYYQIVTEFSMQKEENFARTTREIPYRPMG